MARDEERIVKKVAFIQNRVQRGGRFQVSVQMIKALNEMGIEPDFYCYRARLKSDQIKREYDESLSFNFIVIPELKLPFEWNILFFNRVINRYLKIYDLVINSNNTSYGLSPDLNLMSYVHFPRKYRMRSPLKSIHFPEGQKKSFLDIGSDPLRLAGFYYRWDKGIYLSDMQIANSQFTAEAIAKTYHVNPPQVLYPPVDVEIIQPKKKAKTIISLGRFSADKRQLEQIKMMSDLPDYRLVLMGFVNDKSYYEKCQKAIKDLNLENVEFWPDATIEERNELLAESQFFIHTLRNEPFGITAVQAIAAGAIPIVHNSGGQKEVVPIDELRFDKESEIPSLFDSLKSQEVLDEYRDKLQAHIKQFSSESFRELFKNLVLKKIR